MISGVAEDLDGKDDEFILWKGEYLIKQDLTKALHDLEAIEYADS